MRWELEDEGVEIEERALPGMRESGEELWPGDLILIAADAWRR